MARIMTHWACLGWRQVWIVVRMNNVSSASRTNHGARGSERRERQDRRRRSWWSLLYGSFNPRRRRPARRLGDARFHPVDWYSPHLLAVSICILLLSATDAFLTAFLLLHGADEVNPIMAVFVYRSVATFAAFKMAMTATGIVVLVFLARHRFMRLVRVELLMYAVLAIYGWLIAYEMWMLKGPNDLPLL